MFPRLQAVSRSYLASCLNLLKILPKKLGVFDRKCVRKCETAFFLVQPMLPILVGNQSNFESYIRGQTLMKTQSDVKDGGSTTLYTTNTVYTVKSVFTVYREVRSEYLISVHWKVDGRVEKTQFVHP